MLLSNEAISHKKNKMENFVAFCSLHLQVFLILDVAEEKIFDLGVEGCEPLFLLSVGEVDVHVGTGGDDVELGVEDIDTVDDSVESREGEGSVALVLSNGGLAEHVSKQKKTS